MDWHERASERVAATPELDAHSEHVLYDWPEGDDHWEWVATAPVAEILAWCRDTEPEPLEAEKG